MSLIQKKMGHQAVVVVKYSMHWRLTQDQSNEVRYPLFDSSHLQMGAQALNYDRSTNQTSRRNVNTAVEMKPVVMPKPNVATEEAPISLGTKSHDLSLMVLKKIQKDNQTRRKRERSVSPLCDPDLLEDLIERHKHMPTLSKAMKKFRTDTPVEGTQKCPSKEHPKEVKVNNWNKLTGLDNASLQEEYAEYQETTGKWEQLLYARHYAEIPKPKLVADVDLGANFRQTKKCDVAKTSNTMDFKVHLNPLGWCAWHKCNRPGYSNSGKEMYLHDTGRITGTKVAVFDTHKY